MRFHRDSDVRRGSGSLGDRGSNAVSEHAFGVARDHGDESSPLLSSTAINEGDKDSDAWGPPGDDAARSHALLPPRDGGRKRLLSRASRGAATHGAMDAGGGVAAAEEPGDTESVRGRWIKAARRRWGKVRAALNDTPPVVYVRKIFFLSMIFLLFYS